MPRQILYPLIACLLAGGVLAITLIFSPSLPDPGEHVIPPRPDPNAQYEGIDPSKPQPRGKNPVTASGEVADYFIRKVDDKKQQIIIMTGKRLRPRPNGVSDVDEPSAQIHLVPGQRVFEIKGARGTLVAPNNNPESGVLSGGVTVTLYESASPDKLVKIAEQSPDAKLRIFFDDDVRFDLELGSVESAGPMHATSPRVDFQGKGLNLVYNEKRRHIARFEVTQGKELRFNPRALPGEIAAAAQPATPVGPTKGDTAKDGAAKDGAAKEGVPKEVETKPAPDAPTFYKAIFENQVAVRSPDAAIMSRQLHVVFGFAQQSEALHGASGAGSAGAAGGAASSGPVPGAPEPTNPKPAPIASKPAPGRSMMPVRGDDIVVNWAGSLLLEPLENRPADLAGPDDTLFTLIGDVKVRSARSESVAAELIEYVTSAAVVRMNGSEQSPIVIESPRMGRLVAQRKLVLNQKTGEGTITGAGELVGQAQPADPNAKEPAQRLPTELAVRWSEGVDLSFFVDDRASAEPAKNKPGETHPAPVLSPAARLDALKTALFRGQVKVGHPQFDMGSDRLAIAMDEPTEKEQAPRLVKATGHVLARAKGDGKQPAMDIASEDLQIAFALNTKGKPAPSRLMARTNVKASQPGRVINAGMLDVTLVEKPLAPGSAGGTAGGTAPHDKERDLNPPSSAKLAIHRVIASDGVRIELDQPRTLVLGHKLNADLALGLMQVLGDGDKPARVEREDNALSGREIVVSDPDQTVHVEGAGAAEFLVRSAEHKAATADVKTDPTKVAADVKPAPAQEKPAKPPADETPQRLKIVWLKSMDFDNLKGEAHFRGQVVATSDRGLDLTRFQAGDLRLQIDPFDKKKSDGFKGFLNPQAAGAPPAASAPTVAAVPTAPPAATTKQPARQLRKLVAEESVVFESEEWLDRVGGKLATRFRLTGPVLTFDSTAEQILIPGAGTLQIEDYKGKGNKPAAAAATPAITAAAKTGAEKNNDANATPPEIAFVGKGVTLFLWQGQLTLDAARNDVRFDKDVRMIQLQEGRTDDVRMECQAIAADFEATGGLASWLTGKPKEPKIDNITATGPIEIKHQGRTVRADQLYYTEAKKMVLLSSEGIRRVELEEGDTVRPARRFRWYLDRDKWVAEEPDAVRTGTKGK